MGRACSKNGAKSNAYKILLGMLEGMRPLGKPRHMWVDNIKMDLGEIPCVVMDLIHLTQDRDQWKALVNTVMNIRVSQTGFHLYV
jgi:hypothetical protein